TQIGVRWAGGHSERVPHCQPVEELRVGRDEVKRDGAGGVVYDDPAREVAAGGVSGGRGAADRDPVEGGGLPALELEVAFDRAAEVFGADGLTVRVADPAPQ